jgi:insulysin
LNKFSIGNVKTLKQEGIREALLNFHKTWYSSNLMKLCISANHSLETMESWVREMFAGVPNKNVTPAKLDEPLKPFTPECLGQILKFIPIKDKDVLSIMWPSLPYTQEEYRTQPLKYLSHLFGHEGENSLLSYLMKEGLALGLSSYPDHELYCISTFSIDITLTKKGLQHIEQVVAAVFRYAQIIRDAGVQDYVFEEMRTAGRLHFDYMDKEDPVDYVVNIAKYLQLFDTPDKLKEIIKHQHVVEELDKPRTQEMLDLVSQPEGSLIIIRSKSFEATGECTQEDTYFGTKYVKQPYSESLLEKMKAPTKLVP